MKTFAIGDIHGAHKALVQCLKRSGFDYEKDRLIALGDVCDGFPQVKECIDELLKIRHCDYIIGNHDLWALDWAVHGDKPTIWVSQGGRQTLESYAGGPMPKAHVDFLKHAHLWVEYNNKLFVHGGIDPNRKIEKHDVQFLAWDRSLVESAWNKSQKDPKYKFSRYDEIFVGHTTTQWVAVGKAKMDPGTTPIFLCNVVMLDTGAGWSGKLTIMDVDSHEYWQSDATPELYGMEGRR